jgi:hypothetical protein
MYSNRRRRRRAAQYEVLGVLRSGRQFQLAGNMFEVGQALYIQQALAQVLGLQGDAGNWRESVSKRL